MDNDKSFPGYEVVAAYSLSYGTANSYNRAHPGGAGIMVQSCAA